MSQWMPLRTLAESNAILCAPGSLHEVEQCLIDGRLQRVYKNLWPSLRAFWLWASQEHSNSTYTVFEQQRLTFRHVSERAAKAASIFQELYGIRKGDRVGICSRNYPEYLVVFWACHLIGAVSVLTNAWLPLDTLHYCLAHTQCKLIILDPERADRLEPGVEKLVTDAGTVGFVVLESHEGKGLWKGMQTWKSVLDNFKGDILKVLETDPNILPEDNATIVFTSGTTGLPKGVLSTQRMFLTNVPNVLVASRRAILRRGEDIPTTPVDPQKGVLVSVPLFHVTGLNSYSMLASLTGMKLVFMRKWIPEEAARLIKNENVGAAGGVPSMVTDLTENEPAGYSLDTLMFGGAPAPNLLSVRAMQVFPSAIMSQGYGLTETNSVAVSLAGNDYILRPSSCGLPTPVNDVVIMNGNTCVPPGVVGEVCLRGPNVMKEYWHDEVSTNKALTRDGWLRTGDLGSLDDEGFLYIRGRIKDMIIRGGENIDCLSVENAIYAASGVLEVAAVGVPHERLGEQVAAVVSRKPGFRDEVTEASLISLAEKSLPKYAVPVIIVIQDNPFERTPSGKILKQELREIAREAWAKRSNGALHKL